MKTRIILISNTCPYEGEVFLRNELDHIPSDQNTTVLPILLNSCPAPILLEKNNVEIQSFASVPSLSDRIAAGITSIFALVKYHEYKEVFRRGMNLRNLTKALKFSYMSESRVRCIRRWLNRNDSDEIYLFYSYWLYEAAYVAARLRESYPGSRFVSRCHGFDLYESRHRNGYLPFREYLVASADAVFPISDDGKEYISRTYKKKWDSKTTVMRLGTNDYGRNPDRMDAVFTIVSCSNLVSVKRVDRIIAALECVMFPVHWYHFGDGVLRTQLEQMAEALPDNVVWRFMGAVPNQNVMQFYQNHHVDVFVNVSSSEGVPVSIMEALSFGIPIIATDVGGTHEIVASGENGILIPENFCSKDLLEAIAMFRNAEFSEKYRKRARIAWEEKCNASNNYMMFYRMLRTMEDERNVCG